MIILVARQATAEKMPLCSWVVSTSRRQQKCLSSDSWQGSDQRRCVRPRRREGKIAASGGESWEEKSCVHQGSAGSALRSHRKGQLKMAADCSKKNNKKEKSTCPAESVRLLLSSGGLLWPLAAGQRVEERRWSRGLGCAGCCWS